MKKPDSRSGFCVFGERKSGGDEAGRVGEGGLAALYVAEGLAHHLLGQAGALAALGADAEALAHVAIAATAFIDGFADLTVGDTLAEANVHGSARLVSGCWDRILMLMRMLVKTWRQSILPVPRSQ